MSIDPTSYLNTDARLITENATHVVVALRVEKEWIKRNMPFLAALSECLPPMTIPEFFADEAKGGAAD